MDGFDWVRDIKPSNFTLVPDKLEAYLSNNPTGNLDLWSNMNTLINDRTTDWYNHLGEFGYNYYKQSGKNDPTMNHYIDMVDRDLKKRSKNRLNPFKKRSIRGPYSFLGTLLMTSLDREVLKKMFGDDPIYHDEFGEGFEREYNEELDDYEEPEIPHAYASYFVEVNGHTFHLGYDHRGVSIEVPRNLSAEKVVNEIMKPIVKSYIDNL